MTMHVKGEGLKFPDGTIQTTAASGSTGDGTGGSGVYTKDETDTLLNTKANVGVSYTKAEADILVNGKADIGVSYTKAETESRLATKADVTDVYTKAEVNANISYAVPIGVIMIWHGSSVASVPSGWALCNGANGTPDLRNRFIMGAGDRDIDYIPGRFGGSADTPLVAHYHDGGTSHQSLVGTISQQGNRAGIGAVSGIFSGSGTTSYGQSVTGGAVPLHITMDASHSHTFRTETKGESGTNKNLPPYYTLAYIMKIT
jgi:hypothetical protein